MGATEAPIDDGNHRGHTVHIVYIPLYISWEFQFQILIVQYVWNIVNVLMEKNVCMIAHAGTQLCTCDVSAVTICCQCGHKGSQQ